MPSIFITAYLSLSNVAEGGEGGGREEGREGREGGREKGRWKVRGWRVGRRREGRKGVRWEGRREGDIHSLSANALCVYVHLIA